MKTITLHLVVAGATYFDQLDRFQGWSGTPLTSAGQQSSLAAGQRLADDTFDQAFASDTSRSVQTAQQVLSVQTHAPRLQRLPELRAPFFGGFEGQERAAVWSGFATKLGYSSVAAFAADQTPAELQTLLHDHDSAGLAESGTEFWQRYAGGLRRVLAATPDHGHTLLVVDAATLRAIRFLATGEQPRREVLVPSSITTVTYDGDNFSLVAPQ